MQQHDSFCHRTGSSVLLIWIIVGQKPTVLAVGGGCVGHFLSSIVSLFFLPLWETARYRMKFCFKGPLKPKQLTNQLYTCTCPFPSGNERVKLLKSNCRIVPMLLFNLYVHVCKNDYS